MYAFNKIIIIIKIPFENYPKKLFSLKETFCLLTEHLIAFYESNLLIDMKLLQKIMQSLSIDQSIDLK